MDFSLSHCVTAFSFFSSLSCFPSFFRIPLFHCLFFQSLFQVFPFSPPNLRVSYPFCLCCCLCWFDIDCFCLVSLCLFVFLLIPVCFIIQPPKSLLKRLYFVLSFSPVLRVVVWSVKAYKRITSL